MKRKTETIDAAEFRRAHARRAGHKFSAVRTERDGIRFPSKLEARIYDRLCALQERGAIVGFLRQPRFDLGGGTTYAADFLVFHVDGSCEVVDAKGHETKAFIRSKKQTEARYPWIGEIRVVKSARAYMPDA